MPFKRQQRIVAHHAAPVVDNPDQLAPAGLHLNPNARRTRIKRVLQQLLDHRRGPLHHLARGNLVRNLVRKYVYPPHSLNYRFTL